MKTSAIVLSCSLVSNATTAYAASCRPLEYAEIKDTTSKELIKTYCYYEGMAKIHQNARKTFNELFLQQIKTPGLTPGDLEDLKRSYLKTDAEHAADLSNCNDQLEKIGTALKAKRLPSLKCDAAGPK